MMEEDGLLVPKTGTPTSTARGALQFTCRALPTNTANGDVFIRHYFVVKGLRRKMLYVVYGDDAFDSLLADVHSRVLCGERVSQMTKVYDDVAAVTRLLEEKEKDLELAARIGQGLLARNKALEERLVTVETELTVAHDAVTQLRHDLSLKGELLQIYTNDLDDSSPEGVRAFTCDLLQRKVKGLEDDNRKLRAEASQLVRESSESELREEQLLQDVLAQLADANNHIKGLDDELANKYEEAAKQREEIGSLLNQLVSQKHKIRDLTLENEELHMQLRVVRECQSELATELSDYKDKYSEILELMHETQEQLKLHNKRSFPTAQSVTSASGHQSLSRMPSSSYHPDSLASELELSSLGSEGWSCSEFSTPQNLPRYQFQRVFDTVRCASLQPIPPPGVNMASTPIASAPPPLARLSANGSTRNIRLVDPSPSLLKAQSVLKDLTAAAETEYPVSSRVGVPGTPGTVDLKNALRRLTPKTDNSAMDGTDNQTSAAETHGWRTPDSIMSTGSHSPFSSLNMLQCPEKLKIIKPMEGSTTLHQWSRLATPNSLATVLEERPGVATRETELQHRAAVQQYTRDMLEVYSLFDAEEDEELDIYPGKNFNTSGAVYTYTNSTVLHPDDLTRVTSSTHVVPSVGYPSLTINQSIQPVDSRSSPVSTYSTQPALAKALHERGNGSRMASSSRWTRSGFSTPNNSPEHSPSGTTPIYYGALELLSHGAEIIRRTWTGRETPAHQFEPSVPRIPKEDLEVLAQMNLMDKLEKLGLDEVSQPCSTVTPTALVAALEGLAISHNAEGQPSGDGILDAQEGRSHAAQNTESMPAVKKSPMHRAVPEQKASGLNMICDIGSPNDIAANSEICAKFRAFGYPSSAATVVVDDGRMVSAGSM